MNTLTKNRILQAGDEYKHGTEWKPIPPKDFGMQIMFTTYKEVRRPSEKPYVPPKPISPKPAIVESAQGTAAPKATAAAEAKPLPASGVSPAGRESPDPALDAMEAEEAELKHHLPTVVSKKAHRKVFPAGVPARGIPKRPPLTTLSSTMANEITVYYPDAVPSGTRRQTIWTGRNGTFKAKALTLINGTGASEGVVKIIPEGARGRARNAVIEFPNAIIPQLVDWLLRHEPSTAGTR